MADQLDRLLEPGYVASLVDRSMVELRAMRAECDEVETGLSMLRRVVQGRLDIVRLELARRAEGASPGDLAGLLSRLPEALSERTRGPGPGRLPQLLWPGEVDPALRGRLDEVAPAGVLADPTTAAGEKLRDIATALEALERELSADRRALFEHIDAIQAEITRRYREGEASVESLLG